MLPGLPVRQGTLARPGHQVFAFCWANAQKWKHLLLCFPATSSLTAREGLRRPVSAGRPCPRAREGPAPAGNVHSHVHPRQCPRDKGAAAATEREKGKSPGRGRVRLRAGTGQEPEALAHSLTRCSTLDQRGWQSARAERQAACGAAAAGPGSLAGELGAWRAAPPPAVHRPSVAT